MPVPFGDGLFTFEPPAGHGISITDLFHIVAPKPQDPGNDSRVDTQYPNVAIITPDSINNRFGGMWAKEQLDLRLPFSTEIYLHLGHQYDKSGTVADGMTFTLHNDPAGIDAIGGADEGLGVYRGRKWTGGYWQGYPITEEHGTFLRNALVIEFDTYRNTTEEGAYVNDPAGPYPAHCALLLPDSPTIEESDHKNVHYFTPSQQWVKFEVNWAPNNSNGGILNYTFDGHSESYRVDNIAATLGGAKVYWGFTGASSYYTSVQAAAITKLPEQSLIAEKTVKNAAGIDIDKGTAFPGDIISYTIRVTARTLAGLIDSIIIHDEISEYVTYAAGYVKVRTKAGDEFDIPSSYSGTIMTLNTGQPLTAEGDWVEITFDARVKEDAGGCIVYNKAAIEAENLPNPLDTNTTEVTILADEAPKKSVADDSAAGQGGSAVKAGDEITYEITYQNSEATAATVIIRDKLPAGVNFSSSDDGTYDNASHTVTWTIQDVPSGEEGVASVVVRVNENAVVKIENEATVQVGANAPLTTNIVKNPVTPQNPEKKVADSSAAGQGGNAVKVKDEITYSISYLNHEEVTAAIIITDRLPGGVDFVSAPGGNYNDTTRTVTWTIPVVPSGGRGTVSVVVLVNESALVKIQNEATVQVGGNPALTTNIVANPVTPQSPEKKVASSSMAGQGGGLVKVGDEITYEITYRNYGETAATVVIADRLPVGVDFVSASTGGTLNDATRTVTWTLSNVPSGGVGAVSLVVRVNKTASVMIGNYATVQVGANAPLFTNYVENPANGFRCPDIIQATKCRKIIKGQKTWIDNGNIGNTRVPAVDIILMRDGKLYKSISVSSAGNGVFAFGCLPIWKNSLVKYNYQVDEAIVPDGYRKRIDGYNIINTL